MKSLNYAIVLLISFVMPSLLVALYYHKRFPINAIAGEDSVLTWLSGVLLAVGAALTMVLGTKTSKFNWFVVTIFFLLLAADERFMFHERVTTKLTHLYHQDLGLTSPLYQMPVFAGACMGIFVSLFLWKQMNGRDRILLSTGVIFGTLSLMFDVFSLGVVWEELLKLVAEFFVIIVLLRQTAAANNSPA